MLPGKNLLRGADVLLITVFLLWGILWMEPPWGLGLIVLFFLPLALWYLFKYILYFRYRCPHCGKRWRREQLPAVVSSRSCPHCLGSVTEALPGARREMAPPENRKYAISRWLLRTVFVLGLLCSWLLIHYALFRLFTPPEMLLFTGMGWYCLWILLFYWCGRHLPGSAKCPHCRIRISPEQWQYCRTFGSCPNCGGEVGPGLPRVPPSPEQLNQVEPLLTPQGRWLIAALLFFLVTAGVWANVFASMVPPEGPPPWQWGWLLGLVVLPGLAFFCYELYRRTTAECAACHQVTDRNIIAVSGRCGHCGKLFFSVRAETYRRNLRRTFVRMGIVSVLILLPFGVDYYRFESGNKRVRELDALCEEQIGEATREYAAYLRQNFGGDNPLIFLPDSYDPVWITLREAFHNDESIRIYYKERQPVEDEHQGFSDYFVTDSDAIAKINQAFRENPECRTILFCDASLLFKNNGALLKELEIFRDPERLDKLRIHYFERYPDDSMTAQELFEKFNLESLLFIRCEYVISEGRYWTIHPKITFLRKTAE